MIRQIPIYQNRIGIQREVYSFVMSHVDKQEINKIADIFAGTASLSMPFFRHAKEITLNDKYKFLFYYLSVYTKKLNSDSALELKFAIDEIKNVELYKGGVYNNFSSGIKKSFFGERDAVKIDSIHKYLHENKIFFRDEVFNALYGTFIYSVYKASNIKNGYFYIKSKSDTADDNVFNLNYLEPNEYFKNMNIKVLNYDYKGFIKSHAGDFLIIDPPINRKNLTLYYPLEYLAQNPYDGVQSLYYEDEFSYLNKEYINSLLALIKRASYKYILLYLDKRVYEVFPKLFFEMFIYHELQIKNDYLVLLEKI